MSDSSHKIDAEVSEIEELEKFRLALNNHIIFQINKIQAEGNIDSEYNFLTSLLDKVKKAKSRQELLDIQAQVNDITENRNLR